MSLIRFSVRNAVIKCFWIHLLKIINTKEKKYNFSLIFRFSTTKTLNMDSIHNTHTYTQKMYFCAIFVRLLFPFCIVTCVKYIYVRHA